jgi:predicted RNA binding protein YcfA (HicA-like mRNA interferase family)
MKRHELENTLRALGWTLARRGGRHDVWTRGDAEIAVPRLREINEYTVKALIRSAERGFR